MKVYRRSIESIHRETGQNHTINQIAESGDILTGEPVKPAWEQIREVGPITAFFRTVWSVITRPVVFFETLPSRGPVAVVLLFWSLTTLPPMIVSGIQANAFLEEMVTMLMTAPRPAYLVIPWWLFTIVVPLMQFLSLLSGLAAVHMMLQMMGYAAGGWSGTYRAGGYASGPAVLGFVPLVGAPIAAIWVGLLQFIALRRIHKISIGILMLAYLLPVLLVSFIGVAALLIVLSIVAPDLLPFGF